MRAASSALTTRRCWPGLSSVGDRALEAIVERHGALVLSVCRQLLADPNDIDDAFQAAFLILIRKAGSIKSPGSLASWLYGVAYRTASRLKRTSTLIRLVSDQIEGADSRVRSLEQEQISLLHQEINHLPEKYRQPIVLCYFEGTDSRRCRCPPALAGRHRPRPVSPGSRSPPRPARTPRREPLRRAASRARPAPFRYSALAPRLARLDRGFARTGCSAPHLFTRSGSHLHHAHQQAEMDHSGADGLVAPAHRGRNGPGSRAIQARRCQAREKSNLCRR